jgi:hypothetical protein
MNAAMRDSELTQVKEHTDAIAVSMLTYLCHHLSQFPNCDFIVGVTNIEDMTVGSSRVFLLTHKRIQKLSSTDAVNTNIT